MLWGIFFNYGKINTTAMIEKLKYLASERKEQRIRMKLRFPKFRGITIVDNYLRV